MAVKSEPKTGNEALRYTFARHETFHLRDGWLYKGLEAVGENGSALFAKEAHHRLGMGINMRKSLLYWIQATGLARPDQIQRGNTRSLALTESAVLIRRRDPYLEDVGTLWLIHVNLASNEERATLWYWMFNEFPQREFNEDRLVAMAEDRLTEQGAAAMTESSVRKDASCFVRTYLPAASRTKRLTSAEDLDCPLSTLGLLREAGMPGMYKFRIGQHRNLPTALFAYVLYRYREMVSPDLPMLSLEDIRWTPKSPGRLLCLDNRAILEYLEELEHTTRLAQVIRTAGLNMVALVDGTTSLDILRSYYDREGDSR